jgi:hypothetical protein
MKQGLQEINELAEVRGSLLCNYQGEIIESASPPVLNQSTLEDISRHSVEMLFSVADSVEGLSEEVFYLQKRRLYVLDLGQAALIVVCTPGIDISLLRLTINVVISRWDEDQGIRKIFKDNFVERY